MQRKQKRSAKSMVMQTQYASKSQRDRTKYKRKTKYKEKYNGTTTE